MTERINADFPAFHALRIPERPALVFADGRALSYRAFDLRIGRMAAALRERHGITPGDRIALFAGNHGDTFVLQFACQRLGAILVPMHLRSTVDQCREMLHQVRPALVLHDDASQELAGDCAADLPRDTLHLEAGCIPLSSSGLVDADATCMLLFTSGTTGRPKAVRMTNRMMVFNAANMAAAAEIDGDTVHPVILPLYHAAGFNLYANPVFLRGGIVSVPGRTDPQAILDQIESARFRATHLFAVPTVYRAVAEHPRFASADLGRLRIAGVGGDAAPDDLLRVWSARGIPLRHGYGMTEAGPAVLAQDPWGAVHQPRSVGLQLLHVETRIVEDGQPAGAEATGELQVRGPSITPGYWEDAEGTAEIFDGDWLRTGDLARRDASGRYWIVGRLKEMLISGGENIHPAEIEAVLIEHPQVTEAAVAGVPDQHWGEVPWALVAGTGPIDMEDLAAFCAARLPRFKAPGRLLPCDALPRNALGKLDRPAVRARLSGMRGFAKAET